MRKNILTTSQIPARKGSNTKMFDKNGQLNATDVADAFKAIASLGEYLKNNTVVTEEQAADREQAAAARAEMVTAAFQDPAELAALGETMAQEIRITADREGFARRFLQYQEVGNGQIVQWRMNMKMVTASIATGPVQTQTQIVRDNVIYPNEFYITARPFIEQRDLVRTNVDMVEDKFTEALEAIMVQEDRTWKRAADDLVGLDNPLVNILGKFTPQHLAGMIADVNNWGITPTHTLIASDLWNDLSSDMSWQDVMDPITQQEILLTGRIGTIYGTTLVSDYFRHPQQKVLNPGDVYVIGSPDQHGGYSDRGGVESQPIDAAIEKIPGRGWHMSELFSLVIMNSRSLVHGVRR